MQDTMYAPATPKATARPPGFKVVTGVPGFLRAWRWSGDVRDRPGYDLRRGQQVQRVDHDLNFVIEWVMMRSPSAEPTEIPVPCGWPEPAYWTGPDQLTYAFAQRGSDWLVLRVSGAAGEVLAKKTGTRPRLFYLPQDAWAAAQRVADGWPSHWLPLSVAGV
jgi:hypothetical protein